MGEWIVLIFITAMIGSYLLREEIVKECFKSFDLGTKHGYEMAHDEVRAD